MIGFSLGLFLQNPASESRAVSRVQQIDVSQLDPALPERSFASWIKQVVGPRAGVTWQLSECEEQTGSAAGRSRDIPACVEMTALLPDDRKAVVNTLVGGFKSGMVGKPRIYFVVVEHKGELSLVNRLSELPEALRTPPKKKPATQQKTKVVLPQVSLNKYPIFFSSPQLLIGQRMLGKVSNNDVSGPPQFEPRRISEGVLMGNALKKVTPGYPPLAKQTRLSGEVKIEVTIAEDGRVIDARAISGPEPFHQAALDAARKWVFKPTLLNGRPVQTQGLLTFIFTRP
jgi:TonB family protein